MEQYDFGLIGLGVMGRNFILNVADNGFSAIGLDKDGEKVKDLHSEGKGKHVKGTTEIVDFINQLSVPRKIMLLVPAGPIVDSIIGDLVPHLSEGDLIIDGGNSFFTDTNRREAELNTKNIYFIGSGVSGGAKGARFGPSIMPGGDKKAYQLIQPIFEAVAAKVGGDPCVAYMGNSSAGNYVKMVHNGIEYGLMQLIAEIYEIMKNGMGLTNVFLNQVFDQWNQSRLQSFLIEITAEIFTKKDEYSSEYLLDVILDKAKQKGTGKWTSQNAMDLGTPVPSIDAAVSMREISALKDTRVLLGQQLDQEPLVESPPTIEEAEQALFTGFILTFDQGMAQLHAASREYKYNLDLATISKIWRGGCIIRASLLEDMRTAFDQNPKLEHLLFDKKFLDYISGNVSGLRKVVIYSISQGIPVLGLSACLGYLDAMKSGRLPLNLIQAQRDHFGSHTYERTDRKGTFHTDW